MHLGTSIPFVPFAVLPRKKWHRTAEKKPRIIKEAMKDLFVENKYSEADNIGNVSDDVSDDSDEEDDYSVSDDSESEFQDQRSQAISTNEVEEEFIIKPGSIFTYPCRYFMNWRRKERSRRMHYIIKAYENKVKEYEQALRKQIQEDLEEDERDVTEHAYRIAKKKKTSFIHAYK